MAMFAQDPDALPSRRDTVRTLGPRPFSVLPVSRPKRQFWHPERGATERHQPKPVLRLPIHICATTAERPRGLA